MSRVKKILYLFCFLSLLLIFTGCKKGEKEELQEIAFNSLTDKEKEEIVDKNDKADIEKIDIDSLSNNANIFFGNHNKEEIYSVTFKSKNEALGDITIFIDRKSKKAIGSLIRK